MYATTFFAVSLLSVAPLVNALGQAIVKNECAFPVHLTSVGSTAGNTITVAENGGSYQETYQINGDGGGMSVKLSTESGMSTITQFEYTLEGNKVWYDLSNINGYPFQKWGMSLVPSSSACPTVTCPAGVEDCSEVYNQPDDNFATGACDSDANMVVLLCSPEAGSGSGSSGSGSKAEAEAVSTTVADPKATTTVEHQITAVPTTAAHGNVYTTMVTRVVTVGGSDENGVFTPEFTGVSKPKRDEHQHGHAHVHEQRDVEAPRPIGRYHLHAKQQAS